MVVLLGYTLLVSCQQINHLPLGTSPYLSSSVAGGSTLYMKASVIFVVLEYTLLVTCLSEQSLALWVYGELGMKAVNPALKVAEGALRQLEPFLQLRDSAPSPFGRDCRVHSQSG